MCGGFVTGPCFVIQGLVTFLFFVIISRRKSELVSLPQLCSCSYKDVDVLCFFIMVPWGGLQCVIVAFYGHTHLIKIT